jgi:hypothetical protein
MSLLRSVVVCAIGLVLTCAGGHSHAAGSSIVRSDNGAPVAEENISKTIMESGLLARLDAKQSLKLYDTTLTAKTPAIVLLSASAEFLTFAVLQGTVESGGMQAEVGQLITWPMDSKEPQRFYYDLGRLMASSSPAIDPSLREDMMAALKDQERAVFWGKLQPATTNIRAPLSPNIEAMRREYVYNSNAMYVRRTAGGDHAVASKEVANNFITALINRDNKTVANLLDPAMFKTEGEHLWMQNRESFAKKLTSSALPAKLKNATLTQQDEHAWAISSGRENYVLEQTDKGSFPFVNKMEAK